MSDASSAGGAVKLSHPAVPHIPAFSTAISDVALCGACIYSRTGAAVCLRPVC